MRINWHSIARCEAINIALQSTTLDINRYDGPFGLDDLLDDIRTAKRDVKNAKRLAHEAHSEAHLDRALQHIDAAMKFGSINDRMQAIRKAYQAVANSDDSLVIKRVDHRWLEDAV